MVLWVAIIYNNLLCKAVVEALRNASNYNIDEPML